jgi:hypothetical protein
MQRFMVSATRVAKNPWYYTSVPGYEILSRASGDKTTWWLDARRRGIAIEDGVLPKEWLPEAAVAQTVIVDDTDMEGVSTSVLHSQPLVFGSPADAMTWGDLADRAHIWSDRFEAHDSDTNAVNTNVYGVDTRAEACEMGLQRVLHCTPALPRWVIGGLLDPECGIFRESFMPVVDYGAGGMIRSAVGPGTLWVSLGETQRLVALFKKEKRENKEQRTKIAMPPLAALFSESQPPEKDVALWESEAGLLVRWGLTGPGHDDPATARAFVDFVEQARRNPVDEAMFKRCFGFGYTAMEDRLSEFLRVALAQPDTVDLMNHGNFYDLDMKEATSDQVGRILGDWLRMEGDSLRAKEPEMAEEFMSAAGRMLERAYRQDNGLPSDVAPQGGGVAAAVSMQTVPQGTVVVMKPFVVSASHLHDPGLLAVYGLYEHDTGNDAKAREFLSAAVRAGVIRPRANLVLSQLLYDAALARPEGEKQKISEGQLVSILGPIEESLKYPTSSDAYGLMIEAWLHSDAVPDKREVQEIDDGVFLFPRNTGLAYQSALVCARRGYTVQAEALIDKGVLFVSDEKTRAYFAHLRSNLGTQHPQ